jgi:hypothetical protein
MRHFGGMNEVLFINMMKVKFCNFRRFASITDIKTLADYLIALLGAVTSVVMKQGISSVDKDSLDAAASIKKTMKVQYA